MIMLRKLWAFLRSAPSWLYAAVAAVITTSLFAGNRRFLQAQETTKRRLKIDLDAEKERNVVDLDALEADRRARETFNEEVRDLRELTGRVQSASAEDLAAILNATKDDP